MAGSSKSKGGLVFRYNETYSGYESPYTEEDGDFDNDYKDRLKSMFDQVIAIFLRETSTFECVRPLPVLLGDGEAVDLFKLFWVVKKRGGFDTVSRNGLWGTIAEECRLNVIAVKLVYIKYLKGFDGWLEQVFRVKRSEDGELEIFKKLDLLIAESKELNDLVHSSEDKKQDAGKINEKSRATGGHVDIDIGKGVSNLSDSGKVHKTNDNVEDGIFDEIGTLIDLDIDKGGFLFSDGDKDFNKVYDNMERSNDTEKDSCIQSTKSIMLSAKCGVDKFISSHELSFGAANEVQNNVETSRNDEDKGIATVDDYDILLSARNAVHGVISSKTDEISSFDGDNVHVLTTCDDDKKPNDDYDVLLSGRSVSGEVNNCEQGELNLWVGDDIKKVHENSDYEKSHVQDDDNIASSRKRKRESASLTGMLDWVAQVAKCPDDPAVGLIPGPSKWKEHGIEEFWVQALLAREALLIRRRTTVSIVGSSMQKKLKMHPSMYEDRKALHHSKERVRCSKRLPLIKSQSCPCCKPGPSKFVSPCKAEAQNHCKVSSPMTVEVNTVAAMDLDRQMEVRVGNDYQAEVPEWAEVDSESDSKWLGTRMCLYEDGNNQTHIENNDPVDKGCQTKCDCSVPGSTGCVRFHVAENRLRLKLELGPLFYRWRFDRMGEEISLSWTTQEEKRFKSMVILSSEEEDDFWVKAVKLFPTRTRENLVSYYFNVLVLRRRSYQNRVRPIDIDSDDDEKDFSSVVDTAYDEGNHTSGPDLQVCSLNMQRYDLD